MRVLSMEIGVALSSDIFRRSPSLLCRQRRYKVLHPHGTATGQYLAYVTAGTIENPDAERPARNIYAFDQVTKSVEPIVVSPADDTEPTWSPANPNQLAFTRTESTYPQVWLHNLLRRRRTHGAAVNAKRRLASGMGAAGGTLDSL